MAILPIQKISMAEKLREYAPDTVDNGAVKKNFFEECADVLCDTADSMEASRTELKKVYSLTDDETVDTDYKYVTNPLNTTKEAHKNYPAKLRNYPIISPLINLLLGEAIQLFIHPVVTVASDDVDNVRKRQLRKAVDDVLFQQFVNELNAGGVETGMPTQEVPEVQTIIKMYVENYDDFRAIYGQQAIDYLTFNHDLYDKWQECLEHWLKAGRYYTRRDVMHDDTLFEVLHPLDCYHILDPDIKMIEDMPWFVHKVRRHKNAVIDRYYEALTPEQIDEIEKATNSTTGGGGIGDIVTASNSIDDIKESRNLLKGSEYITEYHCVWKSFKKIGILKYINEQGVEDETDVDENYEFEPDKGDISIEWLWVNQVLETTVLELEHNTHRIYLNKRPHIVQRNELGSKSACTLPYGGRIQLTTKGSLKSFAKMGEPFQQLYNALHFSFEKTLHKNKDKMATFPIGLIPKKQGFDMEKTMYYADATGWLFFDETAPNAAAVLSALKAIDLSLHNYVQQMWDILKAIKDEWWDVIGMNRQRFGDVMASDGKGVTEQALIRSSLVTAEELRKFQKGQEKDLSALLDCSKIAWVNGKKGEYALSDGAKALLNIDPLIYTGTEFNLFVLNSIQAAANLKEAKSLALPLLQNNAKGSTIIEMMNSHNLAKVKNFLKQAEDAAEKFEREKSQQEQAMAENANNAIMQAAQTEADIQKYKIDKEFEAVIVAKEMEAEIVKLQSALDSGEGDAESIMAKLTETANKYKLAVAKHNLAEKQFDFAKKAHEDNVTLKRKALASKEKS